LNRNKILIKNTLLYFAGTFSSSLLSFLLLPVYTRYLLPEDYGKIDIIFAIAFIATPIITLQIERACYRFLLESNDENSQKTIISNSFFVLFIGCIVFLIIAFVYITVFPIEYGFIITMYIVFGCLSSFIQTLLRGVRKNFFYSIIGVAATSVSLIANIIFIIGMGLKSVSLLLAPICASIVIIILGIKKVKLFKLLDIDLLEKKIIKKFLIYSTPLVPDAICWWILLGFGRVYLNYQSGSEAVGILAIASKFPSLLTSFHSIFNLAWRETAFTEYDAEDRDLYYSYVYNKQLILILCGMLILLPLTRLTIKFLLAESFQSSYVYIPILFLSAAFSMISAFFSSGFEGAKKTNGIVTSTLYALIINLVLNILLVPYFSIYGVAFANAGAYLALLIARQKKSKKYFTITVDTKKITPIIIFIMIFGGLYYSHQMVIQVILLFVSIAVFIYYNQTAISFVLLKLQRMTNKTNKI